jgi:hypothetical protein
MQYLLSIIGLFILVTTIVSLGLGISILSDEPKEIIKVSWKNFKLLFIVVLVICLISLTIT